MSIQDQLDKLLNSQRDCTLTAFSDLSSGLVLRSSSDAPCPREKLDDLCMTAVSCFGLVDASDLPDEIDADVFGTSIVHFSARRTQVFVRPTPSSDDVICAVNDTHASVEPILRAAQAAVLTIAGET